MRTLTSSLLAAQQAASNVPYLMVKVSDRTMNLARLRWQRLYTGSEADNYHAAAMPGDGSLLRARINPSGTPTLYYQRVPNPGPTSNFSTWTSMTFVTDGGLALAANGSRVLIAYLSGTSILVRESTDNGITFGDTVIAATGIATGDWVALALKSNGDALMLYTTGATVRRVKRTAGVWGTQTAWPYTANSISGLAVTHSGDYNALIAAIDTSSMAKLWAVVYGDGFSQDLDTWSALMEIERAESGSNVNLRTPSLTKLDTHRLFFVEHYTGSVAYKRPLWSWFSPSQSFAANAWRQPIPFDLDALHGPAITGSATHAWLSTPAGVWYAPLSAPETDITSDVLEATVELRPQSGRLRLVLRNDDGRYTTPATKGIRPGAQISVSPGYITTAGQEASQGPLYWVEAHAHAISGGEATLIVLARDALAQVAAWRARRQYAWNAGDQSVFQLIRFVLGRAAVELVGLGSSFTAINHKPAFTIHPGEQGTTTIHRLLAMLPDTLYVSGEFAYIFEPLPTQSSVYSYGTQHRILHGLYQTPALPANHAQAFGPGQLGEAFNWPSIEDLDERLHQVDDQNLTSASLATDLAAATTRQDELASEHGEITVPVNCGQELQDMIDVTDTLAGLASTKRRVIGIDIKYTTAAATARSVRRRPPVYEQRLLLGAP